MSAIPRPGAALTFLRELHSSGSPIIRLQGRGAAGHGLQALETDFTADPAALPLLESWHREMAEDLGGPALAFDAPAACHGAVLLFRIAWCYLNRDQDAATVARLLSLPSPAHPTAAAQLSADLALQHLPALYRMAQALAPGDPLLTALQSLARRWPLSGMGIPAPLPGEPPVPVPEAWEALQQHSGLWQLFLDRLVRAKATAWLRNSRVSSALQRSLGAYAGECAPGFSVLRES